MVKKYLLNYKQELMEKRIDYTKNLKMYDMKIKENIEFIRLIECSEDESYESFLPRNYNHNTNAEKIEELKEERKKLEEKYNQLLMETGNLDCKIDELDSVIKMLQEIESQSKDLAQEIGDKRIFRLTILETQEYERQRIARELHDTTVQSLASMIHRIELCKKLTEIDPNRCKLELHSLTNMAKNTIQDMRRIMYDLRPMSLDDLGISAAIEQELEFFRREHPNIKFSCKMKGNFERVLPIVSLSMFRIMQEACNNSIKHSGAEHIDIEIIYELGEIHMEISDDGCGFNVDEINNNKQYLNGGFGLSSMYERVFLLSGAFHIDSESEKGTRISVTIPIKEEE